MTKISKTRNVSRRKLLKTGAAAAAVAIAAPHVRNAEAAEQTIRMLIWQDYNIAETVQEFEAEYGAKVSPAFFDGNSEAFNKMKAGGTEDFDLCAGRRVRHGSLSRRADPEMNEAQVPTSPACHRLRRAYDC
jgi:spermidine/putrescine-binding protein